MNEQQEQEDLIFEILRTGEAIRVVDGRYSIGFVHVPTLDTLIREKRVDVEKRKGLSFAVLKWTHEEILKREG